MSNKIKVVGRKKVKLADLGRNLFVREALNDDHSLYLGQLIESGVKLPPIQITADNELVDGRHRVEAYSLNYITEVMAEVVEVGSETELIAAAYVANVGGSLPPTTMDTEHTVSLLIDHKATIAEIADLLRLPAAMARKFVNSVKSKKSRAKIVAAAADVTENNMTVAKAAEKHDVDPAKLKNFLGGGRGKKAKQDVEGVQRRLTAQYKGQSSRNAALMRELTAKLDDGDVTARQVTEIFVHIESLQKKAARALVEWKRRFQAKIGDTSA